MKFAICNETFQDWPFEKAFDFAAECGYTGVEIAPFTISEYATDITAAQRDEVRRQADASGLEVIGIHWLLAKTEGFYMTSPDAAIRKKTSEYFGHLARLCADLGGKVLPERSAGDDGQQLAPVADGKHRMVRRQEGLAELQIEALSGLRKGVVLIFVRNLPHQLHFLNHLHCLGHDLLLTGIVRRRLGDPTVER